MRRLLPLPCTDVDATPVGGGLDELYAVPGLGDTGRHVRANFVVSADGAASLEGVSEGLSGDGDRLVFRVLRGLADVVLVGGGTARQEDYGPARPSAERRAWRAGAGLAEVPPVAVVTRSLSQDLGSRFFSEAVARPLLLTCAAAPQRRRDAAAEVADVLVVGEDDVDPVRALDALSERGLRRVLCEGGPQLLGRLVAGGLLDELCLTLSPLLAGAGPTRLLTGPAMPGPADLRPEHVLEQDGALLLRYTVRQH